MKRNLLTVSVLLIIICILCGCAGHNISDSVSDYNTNSELSDTTAGTSSESISTVQESSETEYDISFAQNSYTIKAGTSISPEYIVTPKKYNGTVKFKSDNPSVISIDNHGKVTAHKKGTAVLTAYIDNGKECKCTFNILSAITLEDITTDNTEYTLGVGERLSLPFKMTPENADISDITFKSSNPKAAAVDSEGNITAVGKGTTKVTLTTVGGKTAVCNIKVLDAPKEFSLECDYKNLYYGYSYSVTPSFRDGEYSNQITYKSNNTTIAEIDTDGNITPKGKGITTVTATAYNGLTASYDIIVKGVYIENMSVTNRRNVFGISEKCCINLQLSPSSATVEDVKFSSSDTSILEIDNKGNCNFKKAGQSTVTITAENQKSINYTITVMNDPSEIYLNCSEYTLYRNQRLQLNVSFKQNEMQSSITYKSSNPSVASVDDNGTVTTFNGGTAIITASTYNGVTASTKISVNGNHTYADSITITKPSVYMNIGETYNMNIDVSPSYIPMSDIQFTSSDPNVLTIDSNGKITINGAGTATVTATAFNGISSKENISITVVNCYKAYTSNRVYSDIQKLVNKYPDLIKTSTLSFSEQGRKIPLVTIGKGSKKACVVAGIHSREHITVSFTMRSIEEYAQAYYSSSGMYGEYNIRMLLNKYTLYIVPMINPDGMDISTSDNNPSVSIPSLVRDNYKCNANGVNLNRNYPFEWDKLKKPAVPSEKHCGLSAASEAETKAIIKLCEENEFEWLLDMHIVGNGMYWRDEKNGIIENDYTLTKALSQKCGYTMFETTTDSQEYCGGLENWFRYIYNKPAVCIELIPSSQYYLSDTYIGYNKYFEDAVVWVKTKYTFAVAMSQI